jgi:hypothetical protein
MAKGYSRYCGLGSRVACRKIITSAISNDLNHFVIFIVHTQFTNVDAGRILQPGERRVADQSVRCFLRNSLFAFQEEPCSIVLISNRSALYPLPCLFTMYRPSTNSSLVINVSRKLNVDATRPNCHFI